MQGDDRVGWAEIATTNLVTVRLRTHWIAHQIHFLRRRFSTPKFLLIMSCLLPTQVLNFVLRVAVDSTSNDRARIGWKLVDILQSSLSILLRLLHIMIRHLLLVLIMSLHGCIVIGGAGRLCLVNLDQTWQLIWLRLPLGSLNVSHPLLVVLHYTLLHREHIVVGLLLFRRHRLLLKLLLASGWVIQYQTLASNIVVLSRWDFKQSGLVLNLEALRVLMLIIYLDLWSRQFLRDNASRLPRSSNTWLITIFWLILVRHGHR